MARRRLNTNLLGIIFLLILVFGAGGAVYWKFLRHENPQQFINDGKAFANRQQWDLAAANFGHAAMLLPKDAGVWMDYGNALQKTGDPDKMQQAVPAFQRVVNLQPDNKEAWQALLDSAQTRLDRAIAAPTVYRLYMTDWMGVVRDAGTKVATLEANNPDPQKHARALSTIPILNIRQWLMKVPIPLSDEERKLPVEKQQSDDQKAQAAVVTLTQLLHDDPSNWKATHWIAEAKLKQADDAKKRDDTTGAYTLYDDAIAIFDEPLRAMPNDISLLWDKYQILRQLISLDPRPEQRDKYVKQVNEVLDTSQQHVDAKELGLYTMIKVEYAKLLSASDITKAEAVLQDVIAKNPSDYSPRIELARLLERYGTRRGDGLQVLAQVPEAPPAGMQPLRRQIMEYQIFQANLVRIDILCDQFQLAANSNDQAKIGADIQRTLDALRPAHGEDWRFRKAEGKFQLRNGRVRDAVQTLAAADRAAQESADGRDMELLLLEADAYASAQQTGNAIAVLEAAIRDPRQANQAKPHIALAQLYLIDHRNALAQKHIDWLMARMPDVPMIIKLQISALDPVTDKDTIDKLFKKLPESTKDEQTDKLQVAQQLKNDVEIERLFKLMHEADKGDISVIRGYVSFLMAAGRKDDAQAVIDDGLKLHPDDATLAVLAQAVAGGSNEQIDTLLRKQIDESKDPFTKEMRLADLARIEAKTDEELKHLQEAEKLQPSNRSVLERMYNFYRLSRQFDKADEYAGKLGAIDADSAHGLLYKLKLALDKGEVQSAIAMGGQLTADYKEFSQSWEALGEAYQAAGKLDAAVAQYKVALDKQATNVQALRNLITCNYQMGKLSDAKAAIQEARRKFPDDPIYRDIEIQHELQYGDPEAVLPSLRDDVKNKPTDARAYTMLVGALGKAAVLKRSKNDTDGATARLNEAKDVLKDAIARWPDSFEFAGAMAQACVETGDIEAGEAVMKALAARPRWKDSPRPVIALADLYTRMHKLDQAETTLRAALTGGADGKINPDVQLKLTEVLLAEQKGDDALKVLDNNQDVLAVRKARVALLLSMGRGAQAEAEITGALHATPDSADLTNLLMTAKFGQGKLEETRNLATQTIASNPSDLSAYFYRAQVNMALNQDLDSAIKDLSFVRDRAPDSTDARIALADCYARRNDLASGIRELETALHAQPSNRTIRAHLVDFYANSKPPRWLDAETILAQGLAMPEFKDDPELLRRQASMWAHRDDGEKALASIRTAMQQAPDRNALLHDYLDILLMTKNYSLLQQESDQLVAGASCPWWVYDYRGRAKARAGDTAGAVSEFNSALDKAGTQKSHDSASAIMQDIASELGDAKAIEIVTPRAQGSAVWKLVAIPLVGRTDIPGAVKLAEAALLQMNDLQPRDQDELLSLAATLYLSANPPVVDKAMDIYKQMLQRHPNDYLSMNNMACLLVDYANPPRLSDALEYANKAFDQAEKLGVMEPLVYDTKAWVLIKSGDKAQDKAQIDKGIELLHSIVDKANFPDAHYHLAMAYLSKGDMIDPAQSELQAARQMMDQRIASGQPKDPVMEAKWEAAKQQADKLAADKTQAKAGP
jgi:tetratricopeptide (TPR) repeat protein